MFFREMRMRVPSVKNTTAFYSGKLELKTSSASKAWTSEVPASAIKFDSEESASVTLLERKGAASETGGPASGQRSGFVWIGLAGFHDVKQTVESIKGTGVSVKLQGQFEDVAFVAHGTDNDGTTFELLQTTMEHNFKPVPLPANALKAKAVLGQVKLNVFRPEATVAFYKDLLGMKLLSQQRVEKYRFTLWFLAYTSDVPPNSDPTALENREWLWAKNYTQVELQHWDNTDAPMWLPGEGECGLDSIVFEGSTEEVATVRERLTGAGAVINEEPGGFSTKDPDGLTVRLFC